MYNNFNKNHIRPYESQMFEQLPNSRFSEIESKKIPKHKKINLKDLQKGLVLLLMKSNASYVIFHL